MSNHADSAGQSWAGRSFETNPNAGDDGSAPPELMAALEHFRGTAPLSAERTAAHIAVVDAIRSARFLIPLVAEAGDVGVNSEGLTVDKTQELGIVTVEGPGERTVLPVFTSVIAMSHWREDARPVPVDGTRVALAAAGDGAQWVVLDPGSETEFVIRRPTVDAIAQSLPWMPSHVDPLVIEAFNSSTALQSDVRSIALRAGDPDARGNGDELTVELVLAPNLEQDDLLLIVNALADVWAREPVISERVDSLRVQLIPDLG
ncbi:MAG: SseB family protein [Actinomycetales bacterium]|nr:SseB family protein [Actinomycetales bacterium]